MVGNEGRVVCSSCRHGRRVRPRAGSSRAVKRAVLDSKAAGWKTDYRRARVESPPN